MRYRAFSLASAAFFAVTTLAAPAFAGEADYFRTVQGKWSGAGEIVAGKYKNTRFTCKFDGTAPRGAAMDISGTCRVGLFSQPMSARISKKGGAFRGEFLDGAKGQGLDLKAGKLRGDKLVLDINRKQLNGQMVANLKNENQLHLTISVHAGSALVPVIGLTLNRDGARKTTMLSD